MRITGCVLLVMVLCWSEALAQIDSLSQRILVLDAQMRGALVLRLQEVAGELVGIEPGEELPERFALHAAYPNPFHREAKIRFELAQAVHVRLEVYDLLGRRVRMLVDRPMEAGEHEVVLRAGDLASGVYFYRLRAGDFEQHRKVILVR